MTTKTREPNLAIRALNDGSVELDVLDVIGGMWDGITAKHVAGLLREHAGKPVKVRINSPGGSAAEGAAIYNLLAGHDAPVSVEVIGVAASAASLLAMAGKPVRMAENALMMIHDPWDMAIGSADDLRHTADVLDKDAQALAKTYARKTGKPVEDIRKMMLAETWLDADEAVAMGFADEVVGVSSAAAYLGTKQLEPLAKYRHMPSSAAAFLRSEADKPKRPIGAAWRAAGAAAADLGDGTKRVVRPGDAVSIHIAPAIDGSVDASAIQAAVVAALQPTAPAAAPNGEDMSKFAVILAALALTESADEATITKAFTDLQARARLAGDFEAAASAKGAEAVGKVRGLVESQAQLSQRVESLETDKQRGELAKLLDEHSTPKARKVTPATRAHHEAKFDAAADKAAFVADLRGYLAVAPTVSASAEPKQPATRAPATPGAPTAPNGKTYAEMSNAERDQLWREDPDTFRALREDFKRQA